MDLGASACAASNIAMLKIVAQCYMVFEIPELPLRVCFRNFDLLTYRAAYPRADGQRCEAFCAFCATCLTTPTSAAVGLCRA